MKRIALGTLLGLVAAYSVAGCSSDSPTASDASAPRDRYLVFALYHSDADGNTTSVDTFKEMDEELIEEKVRALDWTSDDSGDSVVFQGRGEWLGVCRELENPDQPGAIFAEWTETDVGGNILAGHSLRSPPLTLDLAIDVMLSFYRKDGTLESLVKWETN